MRLSSFWLIFIRRNPSRLCSVTIVNFLTTILTIEVHAQAVSELRHERYPERWSNKAHSNLCSHYCVTHIAVA